MTCRTAGFQVGTGFMVGAPYQTLEDLADDLLIHTETASADGRDRTVCPAP